MKEKPLGIPKQEWIDFYLHKAIEVMRNKIKETEMTGKFISEIL